jgi:hypothetical protein
VLTFGLLIAPTKKASVNARRSAARGCQKRLLGTHLPTMTGWLNLCHISTNPEADWQNIGVFYSDWVNQSRKHPITNL